MSGGRRAALVLASLPEHAAAEVARRLGGEVARIVGAELARLRSPERRALESALGDFVEEMKSGSFPVREGLAGARQVLTSALPPGEAQAAWAALEAASSRRPFGSLREVDTETLRVRLRTEQPQTVAVVLAHLPSVKAAEVLAGLPPRMQGEVTRRIARLGRVPPEVLKDLEEALLSTHLRPDISGPKGGPEVAAEILRRAGRSSERAALEALEGEEPELAEEIRRKLLSFEDLQGADDRGTRALLKEVGMHEIALALRTSSDELKDKFTSNMSPRAAALLRDEMEYMGPVRLSDAEGAQRKVLEAARRLEASGELFIAGREGGLP